MRAAFVAGLDQVVWVSAAIALGSAILALAFLPRGATGAERLGSGAGGRPDERAAVGG